MLPSQGVDLLAFEASMFYVTLITYFSPTIHCTPRSCVVFIVSFNILFRNVREVSLNFEQKKKRSPLYQCSALRVYNNLSFHDSFVPVALRFFQCKVINGIYHVCIGVCTQQPVVQLLQNSIVFHVIKFKRLVISMFCIFSHCRIKYILKNEM